MSKLAIFMATGTEEVEMLSVVDVCRRAKIDVDIISATGEKLVTSSHNVRIDCDLCIEDMKKDAYDAYVIPGGIPGTPNLKAHPIVREVMNDAFKAGKLVAAICAGPTVLGDLGILEGKNATSYPGFEDELGCASYITDKSVVVDGNVITSRGLGTALDFGLAIIAYLENQSLADEISKKIIYK